jgi:hypothetical protein
VQPPDLGRFTTDRRKLGPVPPPVVTNLVDLANPEPDGRAPRGGAVIPIEGSDRLEARAPWGAPVVRSRAPERRWEVRNAAKRGRSFPGGDPFGFIPNRFRGALTASHSFGRGAAGLCQSLATQR